MEFDKENESPVIQEAFPVVRTNTNMLPGLDELTPEINGSLLDEINTNSSPELPTAEEALERAIFQSQTTSPRLLERQNALSFNILNIRNRDRVLEEIEDLSRIKLNKIVREFRDYHQKYDYLRNEYESRIDRMRLTFEGIEESELEQDPELKKLEKLMLLLKHHYIFNLDRLSDELNNNKDMNKQLGEKLYLGKKHKLIKDQINQWRSRCLRNKYSLKRVDEWCLELVRKIDDIRDQMASSSH